MMKTFKKLVATAMLVVGVMSSTLVASAATTESGWLEAPATIAGSWSDRTVATRCITGDDTAQGDHAYFRSDKSTFGTLQTSMASSSSKSSFTKREMTIQLMELDEKNADDLVKVYKGSFSGRKLTNIVANGTKIAGDIEAEGDNAAELYIRIYIDAILGDPTVPAIASGLFKFKVGMW